MSVSVTSTGRADAESRATTELLFQPVQVGRYHPRNRILMAPLTRSRARQPGNVPTSLMACYYAQRASAALIISEATQVSMQGQGYALDTWDSQPRPNRMLALDHRSGALHGRIDFPSIVARRADFASCAAS